jgi:hypothetical protein
MVLMFTGTCSLLMPGQDMMYPTSLCVQYSVCVQYFSMRLTSEAGAFVSMPTQHSEDILQRELK